MPGEIAIGDQSLSLSPVQQPGGTERMIVMAITIA